MDNCEWIKIFVFLSNFKNNNRETKAVLQKHPHKQQCLTNFLK